MTDQNPKVTTRRITTADHDRVVVLLDGTPVANIDLMAGASPTARDALMRLGINLEDILAAAWSDD